MKANILVIDDNIEITEILREVLIEEGHNVDTAHSGEDAISALSYSTFDLIISDFHMDRGNGLDVLNHAVKLERKPLFVFFSAADNEIQNLCINSGASKFLLKPLNIREIKNNISELLCS